MSLQPDLLHVASPRACNTQQTPPDRATGAQHVSLRALARKALACNTLCNTRAPQPEKPCNIPTPKSPPDVAPNGAPGAPLSKPERRAVMDAYHELARTLAEHPECKRAVRTVEEPEDAPTVLLAVAVRGAGYCTLRIPRKRYDGFKVIELLDRASARGREPATAVHC